MRNLLPALLLAVLVAGKIFAWWLIVWGSNMLDAELTVRGMFEPVHAFSYLVLSSILLVGVVFGSRFAFVALMLVAVANVGIYALRGTTVYQAVWDPLLLLAFVTTVALRRPNRWARMLLLKSRNYPSTPLEGSGNEWGE